MGFKFHRWKLSRWNWLKSLAFGLLIALLLASQTPAVSSTSLALGVYTQGFVGDAKVFKDEVKGLETWSGQPLSLVGFFLAIDAQNPNYDVPVALDRIWSNGKVGFVNLTFNKTAADIANGSFDQSIKRLARAYAKWVNQEDDRFAFIAPLPEMNGDWESYGHTPEDFKQAFQHIQTLFAEADISPEQVKWVFAPNGWSPQGHEFERYYPAVVDAVAFSAYNWGYCQMAAWKQWQTPSTVYGPYIQRMKAMAPGKPIMIAQTATTSATRLGPKPAQQDQWIEEAYAYLAASGVRGVLYFNIDKECDWALYRPKGRKAKGYQRIVSHLNLPHSAPNTW